MPTRSAVILSLRTAFVLAILALMPLLALPPVVTQFRRMKDHFREGSDSAFADSAPPGTASQPDIEQAPTFPAVDVRSVARPPLEGGRQTEPAGPTRTRSPDQMRLMLDRLHQLGATYTRLETDPEDSQQYRFRCQVPIRDSVYARSFEQTGPAPEVAMGRVLQRVEAWHQARYGHVDRPQRTARSNAGGLR